MTPPLADGYLEARRQEILDAAQRVFVEKGYASATMNDIAAAAGVATGSLYRYFPSKADLIAEVARSCMQEYLQRWQVDVPTGVTPGQALLSLGDLTQEDFRAPSHADEAVLRIESYLAAARDEAIQQRLIESFDESVAALAGFIERAQASGEFDPTYDATTLARLLHAIASGIGTMSVAYGRGFDTDQAWDLVIRMVGEHMTGELAALAAAKGKG